MSSFKSLSITGWGRYPVVTSEVYRPERVREVSAVLADLHDKALIARGYGRSYGDASLNAGKRVMVSERLNRILAFDDQTGLLKCEAGVQLKDILDVFVPRGWFLPVTPGTKFPSLGGSFACDVHGKNHHRDGSISRHTHEIELMLASGDIVRCTPTENSELFWATAGGMGLTGILLTVTIRMQRIESAYISVDFRKTRNLAETMDLCESEDDRYHYAVCWIDCLASGKSIGRSVLMHGEHARRDQVPAKFAKDPLRLHKKTALTIPMDFPGWAINPLSVKLFNFGYYHKHPQNKMGVITDYDTYFYPLDFVLEWNRIYGRRGFLQYQCVFPLETSRQGMFKVLEILSQQQIASFLAVLKRFGPQEGLLSFPMPGYTLALDIPISNQRMFDTLNRLDELVVAEGGRLYLGKDARMSAAHLARMYPKLDEWKRIKHQVDPEGIFSSDLSRRVGLCGVR